MHGESVWRTQDLCTWVNMLRTFEPLFLVALFKDFYIVSGPFIPTFSILLSSVLVLSLRAFNRVLFFQI